MELGQFLYCLLTQSRKTSSLPDINSWDESMDREKVASFAKVGDADFLRSCEFGTTLRRKNGSEFKDFRSRCGRFIDSLVDADLSQLLVSSEFLQGVYCFCPELLTEGDDHCVFSLFSRLVRVLERSCALSSVESKPAVEDPLLLWTFVHVIWSVVVKRKKLLMLSIVCGLIMDPWHGTICVECSSSGA